MEILRRAEVGIMGPVVRKVLVDISGCRPEVEACLEEISGVAQQKVELRDVVKRCAIGLDPPVVGKR